jgi:hypothetical protein
MIPGLWNEIVDIDIDGFIVNQNGYNNGLNSMTDWPKLGAVLAQQVCNSAMPVHRFWLSPIILVGLFTM